MSSSDSESSQTCSEPSSEQNFEIEDENPDNILQFNGCEWSDLPHQDDPIADEAFVAEYNNEMDKRRERLKVLEDRLQGSVNVTDWCKCGHCSLEFIIKNEELSCCTEIQKCGDALVLADVKDKASLKCITQHPGFAEVCLAKWSLRVAAAKFKRKGNEVYRQRDSEERFLRSVSYRQFTRLVYGVIGKKRIPLPSCVYTAIRSTFYLKKGEEFTGYQDDEY